MADLLKKRWWALLVRGLATVLFGLIAFLRSGDGALAVTALIANHYLLFGMSLTVLAFRMCRWGKKLEKLGAS